ncbi:MAG: hypothetical protein BZY87_00130 [SAR202 cluster bacterium Io17-Chloro-G6]|nr:MAG: hypothetical protein BZY87_00130 [SAR202 cluster bacterium Io17-Chloro-G6]
MVEGTRMGKTGQDQPNIFARPIGTEAALTVVGAGPGPRGPWSIVTGIPNSNSDMLGPPPQYLSVAAWAA